MNNSKRHWLLPVLYSLGYAFVMLSLDGIRLYESSPYHRFQAEALLHGHLYLSDSINAIQPGLAWHDGHVQQVWGLGIGLWLAPFAAVWHLFSGDPIPDRIILGLAFALFALFSTNTGLKLIKSGEARLGLVTIWTIQFCPGLWTLARYSRLVFEETALYSILFSLGIAVALIRVASFDSLRDYFVCCALGGFAIWVRPTHAGYGFGAAGMAMLIFFIRRKPLWCIVTGLSLCLASVILLGITNYVRFGSATEFGHRLTISSSDMMYLTRFENPYRKAPFLQASRELFGMLFLADPRGHNAFADDLFSGQAPFTRWRKLDLTAFDFGYVALISLGVIGATIWLIRHRKCVFHQSHGTPSFCLLLWAGFSAAGLGCFYLYYPAIASRYLLDFSPAFAGFLLLPALSLRNRQMNILPCVIAVWMIFEVAAAKAPTEKPHVTAFSGLMLPESHGAPLNSFNGIYNSANHPIKTAIAGNGHGWDAETGIAANVISLVLDDPHFVELHVSSRRSLYDSIGTNDMYRAQIDGVKLRVREINVDNDAIYVAFDLPTALQRRHQTQLLYLSFSSNFEAEERNSERFLNSVRWR